MSGFLNLVAHRLLQPVSPAFKPLLSRGLAFLHLRAAQKID
jgi:hypothetical protein